MRSSHLRVAFPDRLTARLVVATVAVTVAGCAPDEGLESDVSAVEAPDTTTGTASTPADGSVATNSTDPAAPSTSSPADAIDWSAPLIGGGSIDMRGFTNRAVMLWFWAPY